MSATAELSLLEVDCRLAVLEQNIQCLYEATEALLEDPEHDSLSVMSVNQAFYDEERQLRKARDGSPDDRYATLEQTLANLATIREDADSDVIDAIDDATEGELQKWP